VDRFLAMEVFCKVIEAGSFVRAAERLGISTTAVSRHVAELESHLDTRLLQRTTRSLRLTESGAHFHERCLQILHDVADAEMELDQQSRQPSGVLRISVSIPFGSRHFAPLIPRFCALYPQLSVEVVATDRKLGLVDEGIDMALRISREFDGTLIARPLADIHTLICAAPDYLQRHGTPLTPEELSHHHCLIYNGAPEPSVWQFECPDGEAHRVRVHGHFNADNGDFLMAAAESGMGITRQPSFMVGEAIAAGRLIPLLEQFHMPSLQLAAIYPSRRFVPSKVRAMVSFLQSEWSGRIAPWDAWRQE
jgi:DNA-binding transcriptional LysR family regulator